MNAEENLPACRACGRTVVPRSPFTRAGIDTLIPNGLSVQPPHELLCCSENTSVPPVGNSTVNGAVYLSCTCSLVFELLSYYII